MMGRSCHTQEWPKLFPGPWQRGRLNGTDLMYLWLYHLISNDKPQVLCFSFDKDTHLTVSPTKWRSSSTSPTNCEIVFWYLTSIQNHMLPSFFGTKTTGLHHSLVQWQHQVHFLSKWGQQVLRYSVTQTSHSSIHIHSSYFIPIQQFKREETSGSLRHFSICKKEIGQPLIPVYTSVIYKFAQYLLQDLVKAFSEAIYLRIQ